MEKQAHQLVHLIRRPLVETTRPPLLLLLHGVGSNERDLFGLASSLDARFLLLSLRAPHTIGPESYAWFQVTFTPEGPAINPTQAEASRTTLIAFVQEAVTTYEADPHQVYLMGFSQGAIMSASVALTRPDLVAGFVLMSGRILPEIRPFVAPAEQLQGLPFLVVHGTADRVLPLAHAHASRAFLSSLPVELTSHEYAMGHEVSSESLADVTAWLSQHLDRTQQDKE
jgi:phospholipase/carboxylesterase